MCALICTTAEASSSMVMGWAWAAGAENAAAAKAKPTSLVQIARCRMACAQQGCSEGQYIRFKLQRSRPATLCAWRGWAKLTGLGHDAPAATCPRACGAGPAGARRSAARPPRGAISAMRWWLRETACWEWHGPPSRAGAYSADIRAARPRSSPRRGRLPCQRRPAAACTAASISTMAASSPPDST